METLGNRLLWLTAAIAVVAGVAGLIGGREGLLMVETAVAMAVAAVPGAVPHPVGGDQHPGAGWPDDIAHGVVYLVSDESKSVTGSELVIDAGYTAW